LLIDRALYAVHVDAYEGGKVDVFLQQLGKGEEWRGLERASFPFLFGGFESNTDVDSTI
jgi:hypothetical protein